MDINHQKLLKVNTNNCKINQYTLVVLFATVFMFTACIKDKEAEGGAPDRLFRPTIKGSLKADGNYINATWQKIADAVTYTVQLSRDTFKTIDRTVTLDTTAVLFDNLLWDKLYQLQVRANASDSTKNSKFGSLGAIKTPKFPSILKPFTVSDATDEAVKISWTSSGATVTSVKVLKLDSTLVKNVPLTQTDVTNEYKIITGLASSTPYILQLFSGTTLRGYDTYTTKAPLSGTVIDLRNIEGRPSILADTIAVIPSGSTVLLKRGQTYNIAGAVSLSKSVSIRSGDDLSVSSQAAIYFTSNFNFAAGAVIDSIEFNDVRMYSDNYGSRYIFNTTNSATVGKMKFTNSKMEIFRGITRLQSGTATVSNFIIDNCVIDSIAGYGIITVDNTTVKADNISVTNSTIYKAEKFITSSKQAAGSSSVVVSNCTFNEIIIGSNILIDYGSFNVTGGILVSNCIFGTVKGGGTTIRDVRAGTSTTINAPNNYRTSDYVSAGAANDLTPVNTYPKPSTQLWQDPLNGNFKIIDLAFPGKSSAGDLEWRQ